MLLKLKSLVLCVSLFASGAVLAQEAAPSPEHLARREATRKACDAEIKSTCSGKEGAGDVPMSACQSRQAERRLQGRPFEAGAQAPAK